VAIGDVVGDGTDLYHVNVTASGSTTIALLIGEYRVGRVGTAAGENAVNANTAIKAPNKYLIDFISLSPYIHAYKTGFKLSLTMGE
jgi:hypothetical protein